MCVARIGEARTLYTSRRQSRYGHYLGLMVIIGGLLSRYGHYLGLYSYLGAVPAIWDHTFLFGIRITLWRLFGTPVCYLESESCTGLSVGCHILVYLYRHLLQEAPTKGKFQFRLPENTLIKRDHRDKQNRSFVRTQFE